MAPRFGLIVLAAGIGLTLADAAPLRGRERPVPAPAARLGVVLTFVAKLDAHAPLYRERCQAFRLRLAPSDRAGTAIQLVSAVCHLLGAGTPGAADALSPPQGESKASAGKMASTSPAPGAKVFADIEKDLARSRLIVTPVGARAVVTLAKSRSSADVADEGGRFQPLLARELIRQAVLIAARDELGLATRDEVIGDSLPGPEVAGGTTAEVASVFRLQPGTSRILIRRGKDAGADPILNRDLPGAAAEFGFLPRLAVAAESLSRTEVPAALKAIGLSGKPNPRRDVAAVPVKVDERLRQLGFVENLTAVRDLHEAIRADGESSARLGALARGYAQLGVLSEFHWHPAHKAFKARAMLYAQRSVSRDPASPWGLWNRAFVLAMVGLPREAQADLAEARTQAEAHTPRTMAPDWLDVLAAYIARDAEGLRLENGPHRKLAAMLRMMVLEYPTWTAASLLAASAVVAVDPDCYRAHEVMCQIGGVANLHVATELGPETLSRLLPEKLDAVPSLPAGVRQSLARKGDESGWLEALDRAGRPPGDAGEPSWGVLAHLVRETRFVQVYRRLDFLRNKLVVPTDEFWREARSEVAGHRYRGYLETFSQSPMQNIRKLSDQLQQVDPTDVELTFVPLLKEILRLDPAKGNQLFISSMSHCDLVVRDVSLLIEAAPTSGEVVRHARALLEVDPRSAFAMNQLAYFDWDANKEQVAVWLKAVGEAPALLWALGKKNTDLKRYDEAARYLRRFIEQSPDSAAYELLAANYKAMGDRHRWKETLDEFLDKVEDHGLDHARVRVQIANDFMENGKFAEAKPYAEAAAETWAEWAMLCASRCCEELKDWDAAELWIRRATERYPRSRWSDWYRFCKRTGHGEVEAAHAWAEAYLEAARGRPDLADPRTAAYFYWSVGARARARDAMTLAAAGDPLDSSLLLALALLADEVGDTAGRDAALESLWSKHRFQAPRANQVCRVLRQWLASGGKGEPDLVRVNATIERLNPDRRCDLEFFVGRLLAGHGKAELGRTYLTRASRSAGANDWLRIISADGIRPPDDARRQ